MRPFRIIWLELARSQYEELSSVERADVDRLLNRLVVEPATVAAGYDGASDQWVADFADGAGLISYAMVPDRRRSSCSVSSPSAETCVAVKGMQRCAGRA